MMLRALVKSTQYSISMLGVDLFVKKSLTHDRGYFSLHQQQHALPRYERLRCS